MNDETTIAQTNSTEENTDGSASTREVLSMLQNDGDTPEPVTESQYPSRADKVYAGFSGFVIGVCIALALFTVIYIGYHLLNLGSDHAETE